MQPTSRKWYWLDGTKGRHFSFFLPRPIGSRLKPSQTTASSCVAQVRMLLLNDFVLLSREGKQTSSNVDHWLAPSSIPFILSIQKPMAANLPSCDLPEAVAAVGDFADPLRFWIHDCCHAWSVFASAHNSHLVFSGRSLKSQKILPCMYCIRAQKNTLLYVCIICHRIYLIQINTYIS